MNSTVKLPQTLAGSLELLMADCWRDDPAWKSSCIARTALGAIASLLLPIFIVGGVFGNCVTAYIFLLRQKNPTRQGVYFSLIAASDSCNLVFNGFCWMFLAHGLPWISGKKFGFFIVDQSSLACSIFRYFDHMFHLTSSSLFLLMVLDRVLSLYFPFRFQTVTPKTAAKAGGVVTLAAAAITVPVGVAFRWVPFGDTIACYIPIGDGDPVTGTVMYLGAILLYYPPTLPLVVILVSNAFLVAKVRKIVANQAAIRADAGGESNAEKTRNSMLTIYLSGVLIVCSIPLIIAVFVEYVLQNFTDLYTKPTASLLWAMGDISTILILMNQAVNWLVFLWKSPEFRLHFCEMFCRRRN